MNETICNNKYEICDVIAGEKKKISKNVLDQLKYFHLNAVAMINNAKN